MQITLNITGRDEAERAISLLQNYIAGATQQQVASPATATMSIYDLNVPGRVTNCLIAENIQTVEQLLAYTREQVSRFINFGPASMRQLDAALAKLGLALPIV